MNINDMSREELHNTIVLSLTSLMSNYYPLDRIEIREHVDCALHILYEGLSAISVAKITGSLNEANALYKVDLI